MNNKFENKPFADSLKNIRVPEEEKKENIQEERNPDELLFEELTELFGISPEKDKKDFFALKHLIADSKKHDISYDMELKLGGHHFQIDKNRRNPRVIEIKDFLLKKGYESEVRRGLESATPKGMKYGTANKEERIKRAEEFATKAGKTLKEITEEKDIA